MKGNEDAIIKLDLLRLATSVVCFNQTLATLHMSLVKELTEVLTKTSDPASNPGLVCVLPDGVNPTREEWARIVAAWSERCDAASAPLTEVEVMSIIRPSDY